MITRNRGRRHQVRTIVAGASLLVASVAVGIAQSPNPFGRPSADKPQPGAGIAAVPGSRAQGWLTQGRSEVLARHGIVATSDPLASQAGLEILRNGGNAIDAAVAAAAVLDVTSQNDTGIGGDLFAIIWSAKDKKLYALNSGGWAPAGWTPDFFTNRLKATRVPGNGVNAATVPGAISGYDAMLKRFGTCDLQGSVRARGTDRRRGLGARRAAARGPPQLGQGTAGRCRFRGDLSRERPGARSLQRHPQPRSREGTSPDPGAGTRRVLQGRHREGHRRQSAGRRRRDGAQRPRRVPVRMGRADLRPTITATTSSSCRRPGRALPRSRC